MDLATQVSQFGIGVAQTMYKELKDYLVPILNKIGYFALKNQ